MREVVVNTGPIIALVAATGSLDWLSKLYDTVWIPSQVEAEIAAGGSGVPEMGALNAAGDVVRILSAPSAIPQTLVNELDLGEASVIYTALERNIETVAIDEKAGRRVARLNGLRVTGSLGILVKARQHALIPSLAECIHQMRIKGIWISEALIHQALAAIDESP